MTALHWLDLGVLLGLWFFAWLLVRVRPRRPVEPAPEPPSVDYAYIYALEAECAVPIDVVIRQAEYAARYDSTDELRQARLEQFCAYVPR